MSERFEHKKSLGQHFLTSDIVPGWMCDAAEIASNDKVIEIGPGTGILTRELIKRGAQVIALEADLRAIEVLQETFANELTSGQLTLIHQDVRTLDVTHLPVTDRQFKVVANIPYYLSGMLFRTFLESPVQPTTLVYLVQKEVAKRITTGISRGEKESLLSLSVKAYGTPEYVRTVSKGHFNPPPKIDSAIIAVRNINRDLFTDITEDQFFKVLHLAFGNKRKQLAGNLSKDFDRETVTHTLSTLELPVSVRAEDVPLKMWPILVHAIFSTAN
jgi:16S rRNA (adenine1518-N6/adenine1519-N6)-dimethyltransferase